ncbi:heavy metal-associated isoprenylated plant protein 3-like [Diospyros lotus]|uniref:heavy metal-associated isoprenylated plant protein 3-like n=1 Tax=Diospyros lotus TaxID=55363 RepID=UPI0022513BA1|nr:heavy metal-associated isoprenylated plant protein 3-like [Diospyros lotus]
MGEKDAGKGEGQKKKADAGKKDDGPVTVELKLDLHCEGCVKKIKRTVRSNLRGVKEVKADLSSSKVTVIGKVDPETVKEIVEYKLHKKVELVSPQPKKPAATGGGGGDKKPEEKSDKKSEDKKSDDKPPKESTAVFKIPLHCEGCAHKIRRTIQKFKGVTSATIDGQKDLVTVTGTMAVKDLATFLKEKLKRGVEIVQPKKEAGGGGKTEKEGGADKKDKEAANAGEKKVEANKMEYYGYSANSYNVMPIVHSQGYPVDHGYGMPMYHKGYVGPSYDQGYGSHGYAVAGSSQPPPPPPPPPMPYAHAPQMFSDENPNACSVM